MDDLLASLVLAIGLLPAALVLIAAVLAVRRRLRPRRKGKGRDPMRPVMDAGSAASNLYGVRAAGSEEILRDDVDAVHSAQRPAKGPPDPGRPAPASDSEAHRDS
jgi:hypothetical protein